MCKIDFCVFIAKLLLSHCSFPIFHLLLCIKPNHFGFWGMLNQAVQGNYYLFNCFVIFRVIALRPEIYYIK